MADETEHGLRERLGGMFHRQHSDEAPSDAAEPCAACGEETAVGSARWSDRHDVVADEGPSKYLCGECLARARAVKGEALTEHDIRVIAGNGGIIGAGFLRPGR